MKLEVGKTYKNGKGEYVYIKEYIGAKRKGFRGGDYFWYNDDGSFVSTEPSEFDLKEIPQCVALSCIMVKQMEAEA